MTFEELQAEVNKFTYKPGTKISVEKLSESEANLVLSMHVTSSIDFAAATLRIRRPINYKWLSTEKIFKKVRKFILACEHHEMDEWLRYDGNAFRSLDNDHGGQNDV